MYETLTPYMAHKRIEQLTPEQEALIPVYREKWLKIALSTEPINREEAVAAVKAAYAVVGLSKPNVLFCKSPYTAAKIILSRQLSGAFSKQLNYNLQLQLWQIRSQLERQPAGELDRRLSMLLSKKVFNVESVISQQLYWELVKPLPRQLSSKIKNCIKPEIWSCSGSWFDFCIAVLNCVSTPEIWHPFYSLVTSCGWIYPFKQTCVVCSHPTKLSFEKSQSVAGSLIGYSFDKYSSPWLVHAEGSPAIQFGDGFNVYVHHGIIVT